VGSSPGALAVIEDGGVEEVWVACIESDGNIGAHLSAPGRPGG
jgi:hypothetical protein